MVVICTQSQCSLLLTDSDSLNEWFVCSPLNVNLTVLVAMNPLTWIIFLSIFCIGKSSNYIFCVQFNYLHNLWHNNRHCAKLSVCRSWWINHSNVQMCNITGAWNNVITGFYKMFLKLDKRISLIDFSSAAV